MPQDSSLEAIPFDLNNPLLQGSGDRQLEVPVETDITEGKEEVPFLILPRLTLFRLSPYCAMGKGLVAKTNYLER